MEIHIKELIDTDKKARTIIENKENSITSKEEELKNNEEQIYKERLSEAVAKLEEMKKENIAKYEGIISTAREKYEKDSAKIKTTFANNREKWIATIVGYCKEF